MEEWGTNSPMDRGAGSIILPSILPIFHPSRPLECKPFSETCLTIGKNELFQHALSLSPSLERGQIIPITIEAEVALPTDPLELTIALRAIHHCGGCPLLLR